MSGWNQHMCRFRFTSFSHNSPQILCHSEVSGPLFEAPHIQSHEFTCVPPTPEICHRVLLFVAYLKSYSSVCLTLSTNLRTKATTSGCLFLSFASPSAQAIRIWPFCKKASHICQHLCQHICQQLPAQQAHTLCEVSSTCEKQWAETSMSPSCGHLPSASILAV